MNLRWIVGALGGAAMSMVGCDGDVDPEAEDGAQSAGQGAAGGASSTPGATSAASTGEGGGGSGAGGAPAGGVGGSAGEGVGGAGGCPPDVGYDVACATDMEGVFCPFRPSCSGVLQCYRGKWTLTNPC